MGLFVTSSLNRPTVMLLNFKSVPKFPPTELILRQTHKAYLSCQNLRTIADYRFQLLTLRVIPRGKSTFFTNNSVYISTVAIVFSRATSTFDGCDKRRKAQMSSRKTLAIIIVKRVQQKT
jgi:hypothetical protein